MLFATALSDAPNSLVGNANLISKVYFPRLIVPAATVVTAFVAFLISRAAVSIASNIAEGAEQRANVLRLRPGLRG